MTSASRTSSSSVFTIPAGEPFADRLAAGIQRQAKDPQDLARALILVPSRRAARALRASFLKIGNGKAMLLPRMLPIGDVEEDDPVILATVQDSTALPAAISPLRRQLILARILAGFSLGGHKPTQSQALMLAGSLAQLLDQLYNADADPELLRDLLPEQFSQHWQDILHLFAILLDRWPAILGEERAIDLADRRNRLTRVRTAIWRTAPPAEMVIVAGSTGTFAATRDLIECVAGLPRGLVVLPGLDQNAGDHWQEIGNSPGHPQHQLAQLLTHLDLRPDEVGTWDSGIPASAIAQKRRQLFKEVFKPAALTTEWRQLASAQPELGRDALDGMEVIECPDKQTEAGVIALSMREVLETPGRTAALITPDRTLAEAVIAALKRWKIDVDDSAGRPLSNSPVGIFLGLLINAVALDFRPSALLALVRHPLAASGMEPGRFAAQIRKLDHQRLRGYYTKGGLDSLISDLAAQTELADFVTSHIKEPLDDLVRVWHSASPTMAQMSHTLAEAAERMAAHSMSADGRQDTDDGALHMWHGSDGEAAASMLRMLSDDGPDMAADPAEFPQILFQLMQATTVRERWQTHQRLAILGPVEARMQTADRLIIGGFNEGHWPPEPDHDPWMNGMMRTATGLPPHNWRTGLSAHDIFMAICAPEVIVTRALRERDAATTPSRWLQRMLAVIKSLDIGAALNRGQDRLALLTLLDPAGDAKPVARPNPKPPVAVRPRRFSATEIDRWIDDPYSIYARRILRLKRLKDVDPLPDAAMRGNLVHEVLANFIRKYPDGELPRDVLSELLAMGKVEFESQWSNPSVRFFWWPRFEAVAGWFVEEEQQRRPGLANSVAEVEGSITLPGPAGEVIFTAKADRLDRTARGDIHVIDYKTGSAPSARAVAAGRRTQLLVESLIAGRGGFVEMPAAAITAMQYWLLKGKHGDIAQVQDVMPDGWIADDTEAQLLRLIDTFDHADTGYPSQPDAKYAPRYSDYVHLARVKEWSMEGDVE